MAAPFRFQTFSPAFQPLILILGSAAVAATLGCATSVGAPQCNLDEDCVEICDYYAANAREPTSQVHALSSAECLDFTFGTFISSPADEGDAATVRGCDCTIGEGVITLYSEGPGDCCYQGKARNCLYAQSEFPGCTIDDTGDSACVAECELLVTSMNADAAATYDVDVVEHVCDPSMSMCQCTLSVDDEVCFLANDASSPSTSCDSL